MSSLMPVDVLIERLLADAAERAPTRLMSCALHDALDCVLAQDIDAGVDVPPLDNSAMDGYACCAAELASSEGLPCVGTAYAGQAPAVLAPQTVMRIFTGAPIPLRADTVVMQENVIRSGDTITFSTLPSLGDNIRKAGQDIARGQTVLRAGTRLTAAHIGLLASVGCAAVTVYQRLRVAVLSTGDELVEAGQPLAQGQIYNSNGPLLCSLMQQWGATLSMVRHVPDDARVLAQTLQQAAACSDLILTSGGASVGDADHLKQVLTQVGHIEHWKLAIKPGKPLVWGGVMQGAQRVPLIGLPGNPQSVWVTALVVLSPYLKRLQGQQVALTPQACVLPAAFEQRKPQSRREYLRVQVQHGTLVAHTNQSSGVLSSAVWADGFAVVEAGMTVQAGDLIPFIAFSGYF